MIQYTVEGALDGIRQLLLDLARDCDDSFLSGQGTVAAELVDNLIPRLAWAPDTEVPHGADVRRLLADVLSRAGGAAPETVTAALDTPTSADATGPDIQRALLAAALSDARRWAATAGHADLDTRARQLIGDQLDDDLRLLRRPQRG